MGALPFLSGFLAMQVNGRHSDLHRKCRRHSAIALFAAATAYLFLSIPGQSATVIIAWFTGASTSMAAVLRSGFMILRLPKSETAEIADVSAT